MFIIFAALFIIGCVLVLFAMGSRGSLQVVLAVCLALYILFICFVCCISIVAYYDDVPIDNEQWVTDMKQEIEQWGVEQRTEAKCIEKRRKVEKLLGLERRE